MLLLVNELRRENWLRAIGEPLELLLQCSRSPGSCRLRTPEQQSCPGQRDTFANTKIVGGTGAKLAHWPAQAAFRYKDPAGGRVWYFCGGTAIAPTWILTAAHCFEDVKRADAGGFVNVARGTLRDWRVEVVLGRDDLETVTASQVYEVKDILIREGYTNAAESGHDIALVNLKTPWNGPLGRLSLSGSTRADGCHVLRGWFRRLAKRRATPMEAGEERRDDRGQLRHVAGGQSTARANARRAGRSITPSRNTGMPRSGRSRCAPATSADARIPARATAVVRSSSTTRTNAPRRSG